MYLVELCKELAEKGLNRFNPDERAVDSNNQSSARFSLMSYFQIDIETMPEMSYWDWEFYRDGELAGIGEYRRRFHNFGTFPDFQFGKKKFVAMTEEASKHGVPAWMFVEFDDLFLYFVMEGKPPVKTMRRNHETRTEECVCFTMDKFRKLGSLNV
jgi:hypothetical protein